MTLHPLLRIPSPLILAALLATLFAPLASLAACTLSRITPPPNLPPLVVSLPSFVVSLPSFVVSLSNHNRRTRRPRQPSASLQSPALNSPQNPPKCAPKKPKSFLEKTLMRTHEPPAARPNEPEPHPARRAQSPNPRDHPHVPDPRH